MAGKTPPKKGSNAPPPKKGSSKTAASPKKGGPKPMRGTSPKPGGY